MAASTRKKTQKPSPGALEGMAEFMQAVAKLNNDNILKQMRARGFTKVDFEAARGHAIENMDNWIAARLKQNGDEDAAKNASALLCDCTGHSCKRR
jgi:hypothetical protein